MITDLPVASLKWHHCQAPAEHHGSEGQLYPCALNPHLLLQTLLHGYNNTNPYRLIFPDELHQGLKGDVDHLIKIIKDQMMDKQQKAVNDVVMSSPPFAGLRLPSEGIFTSFKFAEQQGALLKVLPPALLALPEVPLARRLASVMCGGNSCISFSGAKW